MVTCPEWGWLKGGDKAIRQSHQAHPWKVLAREKVFARPSMLFPVFPG